jgi:hypothetical protein
MKRSHFIAFFAITLILSCGKPTERPGDALEPDLSGHSNLNNLTTSFQPIWLSRDEILALPVSGTAWDNLRAKADAPAGTPDISNQDSTNDVLVLAKALVYARTGIESYRTDVRQACMAAINTENDGTEGGSSLALARNLSGYIISAQLVGLEPSEDETFKAWLQKVLTEVMKIDGRTLQRIHEERPNNYGTHGGASRAALAIYLGNATELARTATVFKGWLGDRSSYAGFNYGTDLSWQCDSTKPIGINPVGCMKQGYSIDGALPEEMRRSGPFRWPPLKVDPVTGDSAANYTWEAIQGITVQAQILYRQGYDTWNWENQAIKRMIEFMYNLDQNEGGVNHDWWAKSDDTWTPWILNWAYGTRRYSATSPTSPGKNMGWTDWTHAGFRSVATPTPTPTEIPLAPSPTPTATAGPTATPTATPSSCSSVTSLWQNRSFSNQSGSFTVQFDATPGIGGMDGVVGFSNGSASAYTSLAASVRFNTSGNIDARNGGGYAAGATVPYSIGTSHHFRLVIDVATHRYSAYVRIGSGSEQSLASSYAFRTEQASVTQLNNMGTVASTGNMTVCNLSVQASLGPTPTPTPSTGGGGCFLAGTPILLADGKTKPIENLKVGDLVLAFDEKSKTLKKDKVKETFQHDAEEYLIVNGSLKVTSNHPVYSEGKWVEIGSLKEGENLLNSDGTPNKIVSIQKVREKVKVYNLEVNPHHTYIAGGIVVHNKKRKTSEGTLY